MAARALDGEGGAPAHLGVSATRVEVRAAADGAPEAVLDGAPAPVFLSLSHRAGRGLAVVGPGALGCDLEYVEPRSAAFLEDWLALAPEERAAVLAEAGEEDRARRANLLWTAKEAAAKLRREGLRADVRDARARPAGSLVPDGGWRSLAVDWGTEAIAGWWRGEAEWVMAVVAAPATPAPRGLDQPRRASAAR